MARRDDKGDARESDESKIIDQYNFWARKSANVTASETQLWVFKRVTIGRSANETFDKVVRRQGANVD